MSFIRVYTNSTTYTDISDIWGVSIDPDTITGANFFTQESRKANVSLEMCATIQTLLDNGTSIVAGTDHNIYPCLVEIWENFNYADNNFELLEHTALLFRGYLFKDSISINTVGVIGTTHKKIVTLTIYDFLAVIHKYLSAYPESPIGNNSPYYFTEGQQFLPEYELLDLWEYVPAGGSYPLWSRPPLSIDINTYPDYGLHYTQSTIYTQTQADVYYARIYYASGDVVFESFTVAYYAGRFLGKYKIFKIVGSGYWVLHEYSFNGESFAQVVTQLDIPDDYDTWESDQHVYHVPDTDVFYYVNQTDEDHPATLTVTGTVTAGIIDIVEDGNMPTLDWLNFLLSSQFAWLRYDSGAYSVTNKLHYTTATSSGFTDDVKVTDYRVEYDTRVDNYDVTYSFINVSDDISAEINEYAILMAAQYPAVCTFSTNEQVRCGDFVMLPAYNPNLIHITEVSYDVNTPFLWHYKGRSA